jgi:hypothetical protein
MEEKREVADDAEPADAVAHCGNSGDAYGLNPFTLSLVQKRLASDAPFCHNPFNGRLLRILPVHGRPGY